MRNIVLVAVLLAWSCPAWGQCASPSVLGQAADRLETLLLAADNQLADASRDLAGLPLAGAEAGAVLGRLCAFTPLSIDCAAVDAGGIMVRLAPDAFRRLEGVDISAQPQVAEVQDRRKPVLSGLFMTVEGVWAVDFEYPILRGNEFRGSVSVILDPALAAGLVVRTLPGAGNWFWRVIQADGVVLYSTDPAEVGLDMDEAGLPANLPAVAELRRAMASADAGCLCTGRAAAMLPEGDYVQHWVTLTVAGTAWQVVAARRQ